MGTRRSNAATVYKAAADWVECALKSDDSLFTPGEPIWTRQWLGELRSRFLDRPDESGDGFVKKLERQLTGSPPEVHQLMAEALYVYFLIVHTSDSTDEEKQIAAILRWSPRPVAMPPELVAGLTPGIANPGVGFHAYRPFQVGSLIEFAEQWKRQPSSTQRRLLDNPWAFKDFLMGIEFRSLLLRDNQNKSSTQRQALLHLVHPDIFEAIVSLEHKKRIAEAFENRVENPPDDLDRKLQGIRAVLEASHGAEDFRFYSPNIRAIWDPDYQPNLWDGFVRRARDYLGTGKLDSEENDYKIKLGEKVAKARAAALAGSNEWPKLVTGSLVGSDNNLVYRVQLAKFRDWVLKDPDAALEALEAIWIESDTPSSERVRGFSRLLPQSVIGGPATRMSMASVLLMGVDVHEYPPFQKRMFTDAYVQTGYDQPAQDADEPTLYNHALAFLDRFIEEAETRGVRLRHRLDAQSLAWVLQGGAIEPPDPTGLAQLAEEVFVPPSFLEEIEALLEEKRQIILQGPPGTGKTFIARKLAGCLAASKERVELVQFHPSYAYEDFVQGFRPARDGRPGFTLKDGPLRTVAARARGEPQAKHFLVIDEINRGNLAKVFGELYFLLEYRDSEMRLQYSDEPFSLPGNLYIIGTMNTADRSIALVDLALRRRFYFVDFHPDEEPIKGLLRRWLKANASEEMAWVAEVVDRANDHLRDDRHAAIGPSYFMKEGGLSEADVPRIWKHSVLPYIEERLFGNTERLEAFDLDALRREAAHGAKQEDDAGQQAASEEDSSAQ